MTTTTAGTTTTVGLNSSCQGCFKVQDLAAMPITFQKKLEDLKFVSFSLSATPSSPVVAKTSSVLQQKQQVAFCNQVTQDITIQNISLSTRLKNLDLLFQSVSKK